MLIPSIDLMGRKIVQLVQGERKALESDNFAEWIERFSRYPIVQLIDLDAAMGNGNNLELVREFAQRLPCQVGGGIRSVVAAEQMLSTGALRVILGSSLIRNGVPDDVFAKQAAEELGREKLVFAIDSKKGQVAIRGWKEVTTITPFEMIAALQSFCGGFLYTHVDTEGLMAGIPMDIVRRLRTSTANQLIAAGGIATNEQVDELHAIHVDAVVGMAIYSGKMRLGADSID